MQGFVIDRAAACRVGSSLNTKDRGLLLDFERCSYLGPGWHCVQFVLGLDQRNIILAFKKGKYGLHFEVVGDDFLADLQRKESLIEREGDTIRQAHTADSYNPLAPCQSQLSRHVRIGRHNFSTQHAGRWLAAECVHILDKSAQLCEVLGDFLGSNECALAATNFDQAPAHQILNSPTDGDATDPESRNEAVFRRKLVADLQISIGNLASEDCFHACIEE